MLPIESRRILFVGGKGGVGKTTTAAALALALAGRGHRCLLVSTDPAHSLGDLFDRPIGDRETALAPRLHGLEIDPDAEVDRYLGTVRRTMRDLVRPEMEPEIDRQLALTRLAPGAVEAAMMERVADLLVHGGRRYDRVVFDTAPTGHTLRLLALPEIMAAWTDGLLRHRDRADLLGRALDRVRRPGQGDELSYIAAATDDADGGRWGRVRETLLARRRAFADARRVLLDAATCGFLLVLTPERLPILESRKAVDSLRHAGVPVAGMIVNRVLPRGDLGEFLERRRAQEAKYLAEIDRHFPDLPRAHVPLRPTDVEGEDALRAIGRLLLPPV